MLCIIDMKFTIYSVFYASSELGSQGLKKSSGRIMRAYILDPRYILRCGGPRPLTLDRTPRDILGRIFCVRACGSSHGRYADSARPAHTERSPWPSCA